MSVSRRALRWSAGARIKCVGDEAPIHETLHDTCDAGIHQF